MPDVDRSDHLFEAAVRALSAHMGLDEIHVVGVRDDRQREPVAELASTSSIPLGYWIPRLQSSWYDRAPNCISRASGSRFRNLCKASCATRWRRTLQGSRGRRLPRPDAGPHQRIEDPRRRRARSTPTSGCARAPSAVSVTTTSSRTGPGGGGPSRRGAVTAPPPPGWNDGCASLDPPSPKGEPTKRGRPTRGRATPPWWAFARHLRRRPRTQDPPPRLTGSGQSLARLVGTSWSRMSWMTALTPASAIAPSWK